MFRVLNKHWDDAVLDEKDPVTTAELIIEDLPRLVPEYNALVSGSEYSGKPDISIQIEKLTRMPAPRVT